MGPTKVGSSSPFTKMFVPKQVAQNDEKLRKICTVLKNQLGLVKSIVGKQGQIKLNDKRHVIQVVGDVLDDIMKTDSTVSQDTRRDLINMAVTVLWSDPDVGVMRIENEQVESPKPQKQVDFDNKVAFILPPKISTTQKLQRAVSTVDMRLEATKNKILRREASMQPMPGLPSMLPDPDV